MNKNIALRGIFFLGMPGRKGFPFRATNKYIWYTMVKKYNHVKNHFCNHI